MSYNAVAPLPKRMTILIGLSVVGLMAFGLALSYYKNIMFDRQLQMMQQRNEKLKLEILESHRNVQYLQSSQYKDKYAKEKFGLLQPGEKVVVIAAATQKSMLESAAVLSPEEQEALFEERLRSIRIIDQWKLFLFRRENIDDLKKSL